MNGCVQGVENSNKQHQPQFFRLCLLLTHVVGQYLLPRQTVHLCLAYFHLHPGGWYV